MLQIIAMCFLLDLTTDLEEKMFAIIDIETCGAKFEFRKGRIIEISILIHDGLSVIDKFTTLINPECYISPNFIRISGITNEMEKMRLSFMKLQKRNIS